MGEFVQGHGGEVGFDSEFSCDQPVGDDKFFFSISKDSGLCLDIVKQPISGGWVGVPIGKRLKKHDSHHQR